MTVLKISNLSKSYIDNNNVVNIFQNFNLEIPKQQNTAIIGESGCGKTTLLQMIGLIDKPDNGSIYINNIDIYKLSKKEKKAFLSKEISFIHQFHHLFPEFSVLENIMLPQLILKTNKTKAKNRAIEILEILNMKHKMNQNPWHLSGGERQKIAISRAIINNPSLILADEPTGNLDPLNSNLVLDLILDLSKKYNSTILFVTHNENLFRTKKINVINISNKSFDYKKNDQ